MDMRVKKGAFITTSFDCEAGKCMEGERTSLLQWKATVWLTFCNKEGYLWRASRKKSSDSPAH